jgi:hypothetical protein
MAFILQVKRLQLTGMSITTVQQSQQKMFVSQVLPDLFHTTPQQFLQLLGRDGTKFLRFFWDEVGKKATGDEHNSPFGLNFDIRRPRRSVTIALVTLPKPSQEGEAYYVALIHRPYRITNFFGVSDTTKVLTLESAYDSQGIERLLLVEWTRKLRREPLRRLPGEPNREDFYAEVLEVIKE